MEVVGVLIGIAVIGLIVWGQVGALFQRQHPRHKADPPAPQEKPPPETPGNL
jgi:hypothetical protein